MSMYFSSSINFPMIGRDRLFFDSFCFDTATAENVFLASDCDHDVSLYQAARKRYTGFIKVKRETKKKKKEKEPDGKDVA